MKEQSLKEKRVIITCANSSIGYETAKTLAGQGVQIIMGVTLKQVLGTLKLRPVDHEVGPHSYCFKGNRIKCQ